MWSQPAPSARRRLVRSAWRLAARAEAALLQAGESWEVGRLYEQAAGRDLELGGEVEDSLDPGGRK